MSASLTFINSSLATSKHGMFFTPDYIFSVGERIKSFTSFLRAQWEENVITDCFVYIC